MAGGEDSDGEEEAMRVGLRWLMLMFCCLPLTSIEQYFDAYVETNS